jgi:hypothetical protein
MVYVTFFYILAVFLIRSVNRYPLLIDAVIQSGGIGFVGTDRSTMSEIALRRCQSWHGAVTRMVKWGHIGADDH